MSKKPIKWVVLTSGFGLIVSIGLWGYSRIVDSNMIRGAAYYVFVATVTVSLLPLLFASVVIVAEKVRGSR